MMYSGEVMPMLHPDEWDVPLEVKTMKVIVPLTLHLYFTIAEMKLLFDLFCMIDTSIFD